MDHKGDALDQWHWRVGRHILTGLPQDAADLLYLFNMARYSEYQQMEYVGDRMAEEVYRSIFFIETSFTYLLIIHIPW